MIKDLKLAMVKDLVRVHLHIYMHKNNVVDLVIHSNFSLTTVRHYFTPVRMAIINKSRNKKCK